MERKAEIEMKVDVSGAQREAALQLNANPHQNTNVRIAAMVVHGILGTCQQLLQLRNECLNFACAADIQDGSCLTTL